MPRRAFPRTGAFSACGRLAPGRYDARAPVARENTQLDPLLGRVFGERYELEALLGVGATGRVYRARQLDLDRRVAFKILHLHVAVDEQRRKFVHPVAWDFYEFAIANDLHRAPWIEFTTYLLASTSDGENLMSDYTDAWGSRQVPRVPNL